MKKAKRWGTVILFLAAAAILIGTCAAALGDGNATPEEKRAICDALIGARNTALALGAYESDTGTTAELSSEELQAQIDQYNAQIDQYFSVDNPCYQTYKDQNAYYLRDVFAEETSYRLDGGVLDYHTRSVTIDETGSTALVDMTVISYNKWVDSNNSNRFEIICCASSVDLTAKMIQVDGAWKFQDYVEFTKTNDWSPLYSENGRKDPETMEAVSLMENEYSTFEDALAAANEIQVDEICPLKA